LILIRRLSYLHRNNIIGSSQHSFLSRKSTTTQLLECFSDWNTGIALNGRDQIDVIYLNYAKAFDSVVHSKLIAKLQSHGIDDLLLSWITQVGYAVFSLAAPSL